jgi:NADPH-dependent 7-cyano-7-deazaguanine reductase QueF
MIQKVFNSAVQASPVAATESDQKETHQSLKVKTFGFSIRDQRALHSRVTRARRELIMENTVALCFRLELGVAANSRPKQGVKINSCWVSDRKTTGAGKIEFAGTPPLGWRVLAI